MFDVVNNYKPAGCENVCVPYSADAGFFSFAAWFELSRAVKLSGPSFKPPAADVSFTAGDVPFGAGPVYKEVESAVVGAFTPSHAANESEISKIINLGVLFFMIVKFNRLKC